jgi:hypothetical protein
MCAVSPRFYFIQQFADSQETSCQLCASRGQPNIMLFTFPRICNYNMAVVRVLHLILKP